MWFKRGTYVDRDSFVRGKIRLAVLKRLRSTAAATQVYIYCIRYRYCSVLEVYRLTHSGHMVLLHPRVNDPIRRLAVVHHDRRPVDRGHHHFVRVRVAVVHVVGARPVQRVVGHVIRRRRAGLQVTRQRRRGRVVLDVVRHDHRVDGRGQARGTGPGRHAARALALLRRRVVHKGGRRLLRLQGHVPVVVLHLVRAVIARGRARVVRRRLPRARVHGLHLLLIVSLIVAATACGSCSGSTVDACSAEDARAACTASCASRLLVAVSAAAAAAELTLLSVVVVTGVVRMVLVMVMMVVVRAAEKIRRAHVVLQIAVVVRR